MTHLHFFRRIEGDLPIDVLHPRPLASLDNGRIVQFHVSGKDRSKTEHYLSEGAFHWEYLGTGVILTDSEGVAQYPSGLKEAAGPLFASHTENRRRISQ